VSIAISHAGRQEGWLVACMAGQDPKLKFCRYIVDWQKYFRINFSNRLQSHLHIVIPALPSATLSCPLAFQVKVKLHSTTAICRKRKRNESAAGASAWKVAHFYAA